MRDIGLARRKPRHGKTKASANARQRLEEVDGPTRADSEEEGGTKLKQDHATLSYTASEESVRRLDPIAGPAVEDDEDRILPIVSKHVGGYRRDPLIRYPVEMTSSARFLLDACK